MIFILGVPALFLVSRTEEWKKWGYIFGILAQIFWYIEIIDKQQWWILALNICYTYSWIQGIYLYFIKGRTKKEVWDDLIFWSDLSVWKEKE
jgi:hypothetical protein